MSATRTELTIAAFSAVYTDVEKLWVSIGNRVRDLEAQGLTDTQGDEYAMLLDLREALKDQMERIMEGRGSKRDSMRLPGLKDYVHAHPLDGWREGVKGLGEQQFGRLLGALVRSPRKVAQDKGVGVFKKGAIIPSAGVLEYIDVKTGEVIERTVSKLWAFCGFDPVDGKARKRRRGELAGWNHEAKMRAVLIAKQLTKKRCTTCTGHARALHAAREEAAGKTLIPQWNPPPPDCTCIEDGYRYRALYDAERVKWLERDTTDKHRENHALRVVAKELLKDLWVEARRAQESELVAA